MKKLKVRLELHRMTLRRLDPEDALHRVQGGIDTSCGEVCTCAPCDQDGAGRLQGFAAF